ncbi:hypothetical protein S83_049164 [Arachis hypogaea]
MVVERRSEGGVKICWIHDLLLDLCISESRADKEIEICTKKNISSLGNAKSCRLSLRGNYMVSLKQSDHFRIHSLICIWDDINFGWIRLSSFPLARIVDLGYGTLHSSMARDLEMFIYLRYLRLRKSYYQSDGVVPICALPNLETLIIENIALYGHKDDYRNTYTLPHEIWRLKKLRHLEGRLCMTSNTIPTDTPGEDCLPNLQTLQVVTLEEGLTVSSIVNERFPKLRKLGLRSLTKRSYQVPPSSPETPTSN